MNLTKYKHVSYTKRINKNKIPITQFNFDQIDEFNEIYYYARENFLKVKATKSEGISTKISERFVERYLINISNQRFELVIISADGCYRFLLKNSKTDDDDSPKGQQSCRSIYKFADNFGIDMSKYISVNGKQVKAGIESAHIQMVRPDLKRKKLLHINHIDFRSSYASRIVEAYPELKSMYSTIFAQRKDRDGYYKHVLTNSIGCWQSEYCVDYFTRRNIAPYQFAGLAKIAINGTRAKVIDMIGKLEKAGYMPILTNTDGIWYFGEDLYHDEDEGDELCNWQHDHIDCQFIMTSEGSYQYVEDGICHSVVRGLCNLDANEPDRSKWEFGDILNIRDCPTYKFDTEKGVYKTNG